MAHSETSRLCCLGRDNSAGRRFPFPVFLCRVETIRVLVKRLTPAAETCILSLSPSLPFSFVYLPPPLGGNWA